jgi:hypothetical protein
VLVAALLTAGAALGATPVAHAAGAASTAVHACVNAKTRALTVPKTGATCPKGTSSLQWNVRGPQGPRGTAGASGLATVLASPNYDWSAPTAMASDGSHLWIVNQTNDSVTEISLSGSFVRNLRGTPYNFGGPDAVLFDGSHLWVANYTANTLTEIDPGDGSFIRTVADASVNQPGALAFDGTNIWVADYGDASVTEFRAGDGSLVNSYSGGSYNFSGPQSLAFDGSHIWVANYIGDSVTELNASDGSFIRNLSGGSYGISKPVSIIFAKVGKLPGVGHIWVANFGNDSVSELNGSGTEIRNLTGGGYGFSRPSGLAYDGTDIWVANFQGNSLTEVDALSGRWVRTADGGAFGFDEPVQVVVVGARVWVVNFAGGLTELSAASAVTGAAVAPAAGTASTAIQGCVNARTRALTVPKAGSTCPKGTVSLQWLARGPSGARGATGASGWPSVFASSGYDWAEPSGIASDGAHLWIANLGGDSLTEVNVADGSFVRNLHGAAYSLGAPAAVLFDGAHIWVANYTANTLTEINAANGAFIRTAGGASLSGPVALAFDGKHIWVASQNNNAVVEFRASDGSLVNSYSGAAYRFSGPHSLAFDGTHIWVANYANASVTVLNAGDGSFVKNLTGAGFNFSGPDSIIFTKVSQAEGVGVIWVANGGDNSITELTTFGAVIARLTASAYGFSLPEGLAYDGTNIWVANFTGNSVTEVNAASDQWVRTADGGTFGLDLPDQIVIAGSRPWVISDFAGLTELPGDPPPGVSNATGSSGAAIHGCVNAKTRTLTVPKTGGTCPKGTFSLQWTVQGPRGARGATGASGWASVFASPNYHWGSPGGMVSDGSHLWIANYLGDSVTEVNVSDGSFVRNLHATPYNFSNPDAVLFDGSHIWVANYGNELTEIDPRNGALIRTITDTSLDRPDALAFDGTNIWVANYEDSSLTEFRASDGSPVRSYSGVPYNFDHPESMTFDGSHIWVANTFNGSVTELNASDGSFVRNLSGGSYHFDAPTGIIFAKVGQLFGVGHIWVANEGNNSVTELNASDGSFIRNLSGGSYGFSSPRTLAYDGSDIWIPNLAGNSVTEVNALSGQWVRTFDSGGFGLGAPYQVVFAGAREWVLNTAFQGSLTELPAG